VFFHRLWRMVGIFPLGYGPNDQLAMIPLGEPGPEPSPAQSGSLPEPAARGLAAGTPGIHAGISLARAGDMSLSRSAELPWRGRLFATLGVDPRHVYALHQVHSRSVLVIDSQDPRALETVEADGMVTSRPDAILTVTVADCLPIFLVDRDRGAFGIVHSGWKGTGIVREALRLMEKEYGTAPADVTAALGPCIGPCCYKVQRGRWERFRLDFGDHAVSRGAGPDDYRIDLRAANVELLAQAGVTDVSIVKDCTSCSEALGSFRRQGPESFTRMLAFIGRLPSGGHKPGRSYPEAQGEAP